VFLVVVCLAQHVQSDWIDPDTPEWAFTTEPINVRKGMHHYETASTNANTRKSRKRTRHPTMSPRPTQSPAPSNVPSNEPSSSPTMTERMFELVFSDEFNVDERSFHDGADPKWTALDKNDYTNDALHYYSPLNVNTKNGSLVITTQAVDTDLIGYDDVRRKRTRTTKHFRSGMVQSWNKFCFTGGIVEAQVQLPGSARVGGLWPAFWLLGNLARHTYVGSSEHIWPWSSAECTEKAGWAQQVSGCDFVSHYGTCFD
jgi:beta-glucanase (GH16 family)